MTAGLVRQCIAEVACAGTSMCVCVCVCTEATCIELMCIHIDTVFSTHFSILNCVFPCFQHVCVPQLLTAICTGLASLAPRSVHDDFAAAVDTGHELAKALANTLRVLGLIQDAVPRFPMADKVLEYVLPEGQLEEAIASADALLEQAMPKLWEWQERVDTEATPSRLLQWSAQPGAAEGRKRKPRRPKGKGSASEK